MSNTREFTDRNPDIPIAGKLLTSVATVGDSLKSYSHEEAAFNIIKLKCKRKETQANANLGYSQFLPTESIKDLLSPELKKSRFVAFKEKFSEDMYFKKAELGQALALQSKPQQFTNENFTYGFKTKTSESVYDLICLNKKYDVSREFLKRNDKYLISYKNYLPSERINRCYNDNFNPLATYGIFNNVDQTGHRIKKCMHHCDRMVIINKAQKIFLDRTTGQLGKKKDCYNLNLDPYQTFGIQTKNKSNFDIRALIENVEPCAKRIEVIEAISHIDKLRRTLFNRNDFHMYDLKVLLNKYEESDSGFITLKSIMRVLRSLQIQANEKKIRIAISHFEMLKDETKTIELVSIEEFWKILHMQYPLPRKIIMSNPSKDENKQTNYRLMCSDREKPILQEMPRKFVDERTTSGNLIAPDIPMHYGLNPSDFNVLRSKEELRRIFKHLLPENFNQVWQIASPETYDEASFKMSVTEFRNVIEQFNNRHLNN